MLGIKKMFHKQQQPPPHDQTTTTTKKKNSGVNDGKRNSSSGSSNNHRDSSATFFLHHLPSERDRKATIGCLVAVLIIIASSSSSSSSHQHYRHRNTGGGGAKRRKSVGSGSSSSKDNTNDNNGDSSSYDRTKEFQSELLSTAVELLYLDPETHSPEFYSPMMRRMMIRNEKKNKTKAAEEKEAERQFLEPFLSSFSSEEAGFRCVSLLLFRFLLWSGGGGEEEVSRGDDDDGGDDSTTKNNNNDNNDCNSGGGRRRKMIKKKKKNRTIVGYDARVRFAFRYLSVSILSHWDPIRKIIDIEEDEDGDANRNASKRSIRERAARRFEAIENELAQHLSVIASTASAATDEEEEETARKKREEKKDKENNSSSSSSSSSKLRFSSSSSSSKILRSVVRGTKIGGAGLAAGAVFAITGGIAVPAVIGGIAAVAGVTAGFAVVATISVVAIPATAAIFGVGSGILVARKMSERTKGLAEFDIVAHHHRHRHHHPHRFRHPHPHHNQQHHHQQQQQHSPPPPPPPPKLLSRTICVNGWLSDEHDFERPFGVTPKLLNDKLELLRRFCSVHAPGAIPSCETILDDWKGQEDELWDVIRQAYDGKDPDRLLPLDHYHPDNDPSSFPLTSSSPLSLSSEEKKFIDAMIRETTGFTPSPRPEDSSLLSSLSSSSPLLSSSNLLPPVNLLEDVLTNKQNNNNGNGSSSSRTNNNDNNKNNNNNNNEYRSCQAWDFLSEYGRSAELYSVSWEKELLLSLRGSAKSLRADLAIGATERVLKKTVFASLLSAVAIPATLLSLTNVIDEKWTLAAERADEAGILLAESLLRSGDDAGRKPATLIGVSFGARMIVSCLTELARRQRVWEHRHRQQQQRNHWNKNDNGNNNNIKLVFTDFAKAGDSIRKSIKKGVGESMMRKSIADSVTKQKKTKTTTTNSSSGGGPKKKEEEEAADSENWREPASVVETVVLMGCPASIKEETWKAMREIVAGRFVNCYTQPTNDMMLALMYRIKNPTKIMIPPAGIARAGTDGVTDWDVSSVLRGEGGGHDGYRVAVRDVLKFVGFDQPTTTTQPKLVY